MIIVSASGMLTSGRVLHHLAPSAAMRANAVILAGLGQAARCAALAAGARNLRIHGGM